MGGKGHAGGSLNDLVVNGGGVAPAFSYVTDSIGGGLDGGESGNRARCRSSSNSHRTALGKAPDRIG